MKGQETAKRALEIAAAGGHNLLMIGPPGAGKSLLASCLPGILPELTPATGFIPPDFAKIPNLDSTSILDLARSRMRDVVSGLPAGVQDAVAGTTESAVKDGATRAAGQALGDWGDRARSLIGATGLGPTGLGATDLGGGAGGIGTALEQAAMSPGGMKDAVQNALADKASSEKDPLVGSNDGSRSSVCGALMDTESM